MDAEQAIARLNNFIALLDEWKRRHEQSIRDEIIQERLVVEQLVDDAGCSTRFTIGPPPIVGGFIMRNINPFDVIFDPPYRKDVIPMVRDMVVKTIGVIKKDGLNAPQKEKIEKATAVEAGYAFIAMAIDDKGKSLADVLDAIKEAAKRLGIEAERIDDQKENTRITDRIISSIDKAEFVICDLTGNRPNVFYEAGYAHGIGKLPIYIARAGTSLHFDLKDYPVIFFENMRELKAGLIDRLTSLKQVGEQA